MGDFKANSSGTVYWDSHQATDCFDTDLARWTWDDRRLGS